MNSPKTQSPTKLAQIIWAALLGSQFLYLFVLFNMNAKSDVQAVGSSWLPNWSDPFQRSLTLAALLPLAASYVVPPIIVRFYRKEYVQADLSSSALQSDPSVALRTVTALFPAFMVRLALLEAVCLFGFVIANQTHQPTLMIPFLAISSLNFLKCFPSSVQKMRSDLKVKMGNRLQSE